jgi:hypothetical protein
MPHLLRHREPSSDVLREIPEVLALRLWEKTKHLCEVRPVDGMFGTFDGGGHGGAAFTESCLRGWASATIFGDERELDEAVECMRTHMHGPFVRAVEKAEDGTGQVCRYLEDSVTMQGSSRWRICRV